MGPQSRPVEFSRCPRAGSGRSVVLARPVSSPALSPAAPVHFPRGERHDRFPGLQKPPVEGSSPGLALGECYSLGRWTGRGTEEFPAAPASVAPLVGEEGSGGQAPTVRSSKWVDCLTVRPKRSAVGETGLAPVAISVLRVSGESVGTPSDPS